jgi:hypothetical protein
VGIIHKFLLAAFTGIGIGIVIIVLVAIIDVIGLLEEPMSGTAISD